MSKEDIEKHPLWINKLSGSEKEIIAVGNRTVYYRRIKDGSEYIMGVKDFVFCHKPKDEE